MARPTANSKALDLDCPADKYDIITAFDRIIFKNKETGEQKVYAVIPYKTYPLVTSMAKVKGVTLNDMAKALGVSRATLSHAINGRRNFRKEWKPIIARVLGVSQEVLFGED